MIVRVTGFGKAVKMALDEVLVKIDVAYQNPQRTTSRKDTGALSDSAISRALSLTLAFLVLTVLIASLKLFCRDFLPPPSLPFAQDDQVLLAGSLCLRAGHRSLECSPGGSPLYRGFGLGPREIVSSPSLSIAWSSKSGNLKLVGVEAAKLFE